MEDDTPLAALLSHRIGGVRYNECICKDIKGSVGLRKGVLGKRKKKNFMEMVL